MILHWILLVLASACLVLGVATAFMAKVPLGRTAYTIAFAVALFIVTKYWL